MRWQSWTHKAVLHKACPFLLEGPEGLLRNARARPVGERKRIATGSQEDNCLRWAHRSPGNGPPGLKDARKRFFRGAQETQDPNLRARTDTAPGSARLHPGQHPLLQGSRVAPSSSLRFHRNKHLQSVGLGPPQKQGVNENMGTHSSPGRRSQEVRMELAGRETGKGQKMSQCSH